MPDENAAKDGAAQAAAPQAVARQPYVSPRLVELGTLAELTKGGDQEQRGEGPGFSL